MSLYLFHLIFDAYIFPTLSAIFRNKGKIKRGKDGQLLIDYKHRFPSQAKSAAVASKVQLSTGKASITRKVDCWMTFEEYEAMTK